MTFNVKNRTYYTRRRYQATLDLAANLVEDRDNKERLARQECVACYYVLKLCGQGFTTYKCHLCSKEYQCHNTCVPHLCQDCAEEHELCQTCGADINLNPDRYEL